LRIAGIGWRERFWEIDMAKKSRLTQVAMKIGSAMGKADRTAHKVAKAGVLAKKELEDISKQVDGLKKQLLKTTKRLQKALR
jgi:predicted  nucleic acid-binding Zn-ribbon protein